MRELFLLSLSLSCFSCYAAHERESARFDSGPTSDARPGDPFVVPDVLNEDAATACDPITTVIEVLAGGCAAAVVVDTTGNACGHLAAHVRRPSALILGADLWGLIRGG